ncbi:hypothetical protein CLOSBL3_30064 [Clostridiaceae bacterium BL-3]|nr:hypothetical protein CLOSBL3_30064 [Clostridiaceae bacterium BL-3]
MDRDNIIMILTLGKRDITLDGKSFDEIIFSDEYNDLQCGFKENHGKWTLSQRYGGEIILKNYDKYEKRLQFPIVEPMINFVLDEEKRVDKLFIIVTDQDDEIHKKNDTLYFGKIIEKWIKRKYKTIKEKEIETVSKNVVNLGDMNNHFKNFYDKKSKKILDDPKLYVANTGGIDAINTAVLINGIMKFKNKCINLYLSQNKKEAIPIYFVSSFILDIEKDKLKGLLRNYNYVTALSIVNSHKSLEKFSVLIELAKNRLYFNLDECKKVINKYCQEMTERNYISYEIDKNLEEIYKIKNDRLYAMRELYVNCRIKYIQEQYVDFLLRMFRLEEALLEFTVVKYILFTNNDEYKISDLTKKIKENGYLEDYLNKYYISEENGKSRTKLDWENKSNIKILKAIVEFGIKKNKDLNGNILIKDDSILKKVEDIFALTESLDSLSQLRNKSIGAHGFEGISKEKIGDTLKEKCNSNVDSIFKNIEQIINVKFENSCYDSINNIIIKSLK